MTLRIKISTPDSSPETRSIDKHEVVIGRKPGNDLVLTGNDVSGTHASLLVDEGRIILTDLGSLNGTFVNGQRIDSVELAPDDEVMISTFRLAITLAAHPPPPRETTSPPRPGRKPPPLPSQRRTDEPAIPPPILSNDVPPPVSRQQSACPPVDEDLPPVIPRAVGRNTAAELDPPPVVSAPPATAPEPPVSPADLAQALTDPTTRRIFVKGSNVEVERDGVRLPLAGSPIPPDTLDAQISSLLGRPLPRGTPIETVLADGTAVQASFTTEHGLIAVITRSRSKRSTGLDGLVQEHALSPPAAELLAACMQVRLPILVAGFGGAHTAVLLAALMGSTPGPSAYVRGLPTPTILPRHCIALDAGGAMAATVRLALASSTPWLALDEPDTLALEEAAWAATTGVGLAVGIRAESLRHGLERARTAGIAHTQPAIPYALVALWEHPPETNARTAFSLRQLLEIQRDDAGQATTHEVVTRNRRGEFLVTAVPFLLDTLRTHGVHLDAAKFSPR